MSKDFKQRLAPLCISLIIALGVFLMIYQPGTSSLTPSSATQPLDPRFIYIIFLIPLALLSIAFYQLATLYRYTHHGISVQGRIVSVATRQIFTMHNYPRVIMGKPTIRFTDQTGREHVFVNRYESPDLTSNHAGTTIEVLYLPHAPEKALAMNAQWRRGPFFILTIGLGVLFLCGAALHMVTAQV